MIWTDKSRLARVRVMTRPLTAKGAATRRRIVEGGARLIRADGVEKVGLDDVLAATSTSKGQLFHYFPGGRADLLYAVAEHEAAQVISDQQPFLDDLGPPSTWGAWRDVVVARYREQGRECPLSALTTQLGPSDARVRPLVTNLLEDWHARIALGVDRWLAGSPTTDAATHAEAASGRTAATILAAVQGGVSLMLSTGRIDYLEIALDTALTPLSR